jgi:hypothetical protein
MSQSALCVDADAIHIHDQIEGLRVADHAHGDCILDGAHTLLELLCKADDLEEGSVGAVVLRFPSHGNGAQGVLGIGWTQRFRLTPNIQIFTTPTMSAPTELIPSTPFDPAPCGWSQVLAGDPPNRIQSPRRNWRKKFVTQPQAVLDVLEARHRLTQMVFAETKRSCECRCLLGVSQQQVDALDRTHLKNGQACGQDRDWAQEGVGAEPTWTAPWGFEEAPHGTPGRQECIPVVIADPFLGPISSLATAWKFSNDLLHFKRPGNESIGCHPCRFQSCSQIPSCSCSRTSFRRHCPIRKMDST